MGNCVSSPNQRPKDIGIGSQSLNPISKKKSNFFHDNDNNNTRKSKTFKRKKVHKGLIGLPSNFQHTGHIGISELRSGKVDPEKVKSQMAEVAAALRLEINPISESIDTQTHQIPISKQDLDSSSFTSNSPTSNSSSQFHVKRKQTSPTIPVSQEQVTVTSSISSQNKIDPMAEVVAALKMPVDGNLNDFIINNSNELNVDKNVK
ncbi:11858_t:CDS:2 [Dentiscutata erythropus]|uniref:11858_t:CDS:1 n=1 Tax=Dentiscutata erythropus TaxID=1348616 RepID=A0A9N8WE49_9GLOM|nr:11858_t:CDS:2 [Dentiscutata erythropus]